MNVTLLVHHVTSGLYLSNIKTQFVPRSKRSLPRFQSRYVNVVYRNNRCLFYDPRKTHVNALWGEHRISDFSSWWYIQGPLDFKWLNTLCIMHKGHTSLWRMEGMEVTFTPHFMHYTKRLPVNNKKYIKAI